MANKTILIELQAKDTATPKLKQAEQAVSNLGKNTRSSMSQMRSSVKDTSLELDNLGNKFRYLSLISGIVSAGTITAAKSFVDSASKMEQSVIKLSAYSKIYSTSFDDANKAAQEFASTGLMDVTEASTTLSNLLAMGLGLDKAKTLMQGMLDTAVTSKENLQDTFGQALIKSSQGMRIFQERQIDAVGVNTQLNQVFMAYGKTINKNAKELSNAERYQAIYNYYTKEFANFAGAASGAGNTFSGTLNKLKNNIEQAKTALGNSLVPLVGTLAEGLNKATLALRDFVNAHPALSSAVITGTMLLTLFVAAFATIGAVVPMVISGVSLTTNAFMAMATASAVVIAKFAAISLGIGFLIYGILKITGQWDKWNKAIKNVANSMAAALNPMKAAGKEVEQLDDKVVKTFNTLKDNIALFVRDTKQDMTEWVANHDKTVKDLTKQINDLAEKYNKATNKIRSDYQKTNDELTLSHSRKVEDIQAQIDEEVSKGIWADQTKIKELKKELARENEDYALASQDKLDTKDKEVSEEKDAYEEKRKELKDKLDEELALEKKHASAITNIRSWGLKALDDFEKKYQSITDRIVQFNKELKETTETIGGQADAIGGVGLAIDETSNKIDEVAEKTHSWLDWLNFSAYPESVKQSFAFNTAIIGIGASIAALTIGALARFFSASAIGFAATTAASTTLLGLLTRIAVPVAIVVDFALVTAAVIEAGNLLRELDAANESAKKASDLNAELQSRQVSKFVDLNKNLSSGTINQSQYDTSLKNLNLNNWSTTPSTTKNWLKYKEGGIIPGGVNQEVPIVAHGGETVLPAGVSPLTININNPSIRNDNDIVKLANAVKDVISKQVALKQYQ